jgi:hypothetical protein
MAPAVMMAAPAIPAVMMPAAAPVPPIPVSVSAPDLDQRVARWHRRNAEPCRSRCSQAQQRRHKRGADQQNPFHDLSFLRCAGASATALIAAPLALTADINGKKRQWFRRATDRQSLPSRPPLCGSAAQEAVSPWREKPLWWPLESAQRELDKFHDIKGLR